MFLMQWLQQQLLWPRSGRGHPQDNKGKEKEANGSTERAKHPTTTTRRKRIATDIIIIITQNGTNTKIINRTNSDDKFPISWDVTQRGEGRRNKSWTNNTIITASWNIIQKQSDTGIRNDNITIIVAWSIAQRHSDTRTRACNNITIVVLWSIATKQSDTRERTWNIFSVTHDFHYSTRVWRSGTGRIAKDAGSGNNVCRTIAAAYIANTCWRKHLS